MIDIKIHIQRDFQPNVYNRGGNSGISGFKATLFVDIELWKRKKQIYLGKIDFSVDFLSSMLTTKIALKPRNFLIAPSRIGYDSKQRWSHLKF